MQVEVCRLKYTATNMQGKHTATKLIWCWFVARAEAVVQVFGQGGGIGAGLWPGRRQWYRFLARAEALVRVFGQGGGIGTGFWPGRLCRREKRCRREKLSKERGVMNLIKVAGAVFALIISMATILNVAFVYRLYPRRYIP
jgi:hypothetical protein